MAIRNPDPMDFPNVPVEAPEPIEPSRSINPDRRGVQRRRGKKEKEDQDKRDKGKSKLPKMDVDIDVSIEVYDDHEHKHTIGTEHHMIDKRA